MTDAACAGAAAAAQFGRGNRRANWKKDEMEGGLHGNKEECNRKQDNSCSSSEAEGAITEVVVNENEEQRCMEELLVREGSSMLPSAIVGIVPYLEVRYLPSDVWRQRQVSKYAVWLVFIYDT